MQENEQRASEKAGTERYSELGIVYMEDCGSRFSLSDCNKKYLLFVSREGRIAVNAISEVVSYFESHQDVDIIYADEDVWMDLDNYLALMPSRQNHRYFCDNSYLQATQALKKPLCEQQNAHRLSQF